MPSKLPAAALNPALQPSQIVAIGTSAGGVRALRSFFKNVPRYTGFSFVVLVHLSANEESYLERVLSGSTELPISRITEGSCPMADHIHVIPPRQWVSLERGCFVLRPFTQEHMNFTINHFLFSLSKHRAKQIAAVVMSGQLNDGAEGALHIQRAGGLVLVEDPATAEYPSMPENVLLLVDVAASCIAPVEALPLALVVQIVERQQ